MVDHCPRCAELQRDLERWRRWSRKHETRAKENVAELRELQIELEWLRVQSDTKSDTKETT